MSIETVLSALAEMGATLHPGGTVTGPATDLHLDTAGGRVVLAGPAVGEKTVILDRDDPSATAAIGGALLGLSVASHTFRNVQAGLAGMPGVRVELAGDGGAFVVTGPAGRCAHVVGYRDGVTVEDPAGRTILGHGWSWREIAGVVARAVGGGPAC